MSTIKFTSIFHSKWDKNFKPETCYKPAKNLKKLPLNILYTDSFSDNEKIFNKFETNIDYNKKPKIDSASRTQQTDSSNKYITKYKQKFPLISNRTKSEKLMKKNSIKKYSLYVEKKPAVFDIFDKFNEIDKKFNENTKYYDSMVKKGDKYNSFHKEYTKEYNNIFLVSKKNYRKNCAMLYNRIKSIQD